MKRFLFGVVLALAYCGVSAAADDLQHGQLQNAVYVLPTQAKDVPQILTENQVTEAVQTHEKLMPATLAKRIRSDMRVAGAGLVFDSVVSTMERSRTQWS
ncbi:hypothetical protein M2D07_006565 [Pseudomonas sp. BGr12]|uniref:hypothetical protein n=1 Tax=Pseudomonas sp. BGr12 TaxID=2936269 RepID=UPI00255A0973|nr:hypothetical protein [Pseudomonas sp. BJa5]MDL2426677.1 hypothetical protein [Pseudomonas sp. BJa5]